MQIAEGEPGPDTIRPEAAALKAMRDPEDDAGGEEVFRNQKNKVMEEIKQLGKKTGKAAVA
jgi:hypothetical protein